jgi:hypothetical protein
VVIERPNSSAIRDPALLINNIDTLRPRRVGVIRDVVHIVHAEGHWKMKTLDEIVGDGHALLGGVRLRVTNILIHVRLHLPFIERMRFADVHGEKIGAILVVVIQSDEVAYLAAKRRSGVAAEYENQRALADAIAQMKRGVAVERQQSDVWSGVADVQIAVAPLRQRIAQKSINVARPAHHVAERSVDTGQNNDQHNRRPFPPTHEFTRL